MFKTNDFMGAKYAGISFANILRVGQILGAGMLVFSFECNLLQLQTSKITSQQQGLLYQIRFYLFLNNESKPKKR